MAGAFPANPDDLDLHTTDGGTVYQFKTDHGRWVLYKSTITDHNDMGGLNDGDLYEHITQTQKNALHAQSHNIVSHDTIATGAELNTLTGGGQTALHSHAGGADYDADLLIGSANAAWIPMAASKAYVSAEYERFDTNEFVNMGSTDYWTTFSLHLPTNRGGLKLHIAALQIAVNDADANDFISTRLIFGARLNDNIQLETNTIDLNSPSDTPWDFSDDDVSGFDSVFLDLFIVSTTASELGYGHPRMLCYYDT